jgi:shikimate kinase
MPPKTAQIKRKRVIFGISPVQIFALRNSKHAACFLFHRKQTHANGFSMMMKQGFVALDAQSTETNSAIAAEPSVEANILDKLEDRLIVFVGMMASGKTSVGRLLAQRLGVPFIDTDHEIEAASQMSVPEYFAKHGEADFRSGERRVIARLLRDGPRVLATGGGAFMSGETRDTIRVRGISVWLKADAETILRRARRRSNRPLLQNSDPEGTIKKLIEVRYPIYGEANVMVESRDGTHDETVTSVVIALDRYFRETSQA